jgi:hypothetical protein
MFACPSSTDFFTGWTMLADNLALFGELIGKTILIYFIFNEIPSGCKLAWGWIDSDGIAHFLFAVTIKKRT